MNIGNSKTTGLVILENLPVKSEHYLGHGNCSIKTPLKCRNPCAHVGSQLLAAIILGATVFFMVGPHVFIVWPHGFIVGPHVFIVGPHVFIVGPHVFISGPCVGNRPLMVCILVGADVRDSYWGQKKSQISGITKMYWK